MTWMKLEDNMLSIIIQSKKDNYYMIPLIQGILNSQMYKTKEWNGVFQGLWRVGTSYKWGIKFQSCKMKKS